MYKWINHDQSARQQGAIYKFDWEGIWYNMINTTSSLNIYIYIYIYKWRFRDFRSHKEALKMYILDQRRIHKDKVAVTNQNDGKLN